MIRTLLLSVIWLAIVAVGIAQDRPPVFRAATDAVSVDVSVTLKNKPVRGLAAADFELTDNGVSQTVLEVGNESTPIDFTLLLDFGGADFMGNSRRAFIEATRAIGAALRPVDRLSLITYDDRIQPYVSLALASAFDETLLSRLSRAPVRRGSVLFDALVAALTNVPDKSRRRLALVCASGHDNGSLLTAGHALAIARGAAMPVSVVVTGVDTHLVAEGSAGIASSWVGGRELPAELLAQLADDTGGLFQTIRPTIIVADRPGHVAIHGTPAPIDKKLLRAIDDYRTSYTLRYIPQGVAKDGRHALTVSVKSSQPYVVRARKGYGE